MLMDGEPSVRGRDLHYEEVHDDLNDERVVVEWARLHLHHLPGAVARSVRIGVEIPRSTDPDDVAEWSVYDALRFASDEALVVRTPWGDERTVALPPEDALVLTDVNVPSPPAP